MAKIKIDSTIVENANITNSIDLLCINYTTDMLPVIFNGTQLTQLIYNGTTVEQIIYNGQQLY